MPNIKSAKKRVKVISTKTLHNKMLKSQLRSTLKKVHADIAANNNAEEALKLAYKKIDQAVAKGILHKNTAARKKAAVATAFNANK